MTAAGARLIYLGIGANLGDRRAGLSDGLSRVDRIAPVQRVSSLYESDPVGGPVQPDFCNAVCVIRTDLHLEALLAALKRIEWALGRRPGPRWGPRPLDLDILLAGDAGQEHMQTPLLQVPHPRLSERAFVLIPLAELAPTLAIPPSGETAATLAARAGSSAVRLVQGPDWWQR